jgi:hypothetical protein
MIFRYKSILQNQTENLIQVYEFLLATKKFKELKLENESEIAFTTFSMFRYMNWELFSMVDFGSVKILSNGTSTLLQYEIFSIRIWLPMLIFPLFTVIALGNMDHSLIISLIVLAILLLIMYMRHMVFFRSMIKGIT